MAKPPQKTERMRKLYHAGETIIVGVDVYSQGTVIVRRKCEPAEERESAKRGIVGEYSRKSRERLAIVSRETIAQFGSLMTLSYGKQFPSDGKELKAHLNRFMTWYRRYVGGQYIWWLEFQSRGAPHVHIASQKTGVKWYDREEFADRWAKSQGLLFGIDYCDIETKEERNLYEDVYAVHKHKRQWQDARAEDGPKRYILKYALKTRQKVVPTAYRNVGRFWGCSRGVTEGIPEPRQVQIDEAHLRSILKSAGHQASEWDYVPKNIWGIADKFDF